MKAYEKRYISIFFLTLFLISLGEGAVHGFFHSHGVDSAVSHIGCHHDDHTTGGSHQKSYAEADAHEIDCLRCAHFLANHAFVAHGIQNVVDAGSCGLGLFSLKSFFTHRPYSSISLRGPPIC